MRNWCLALVLSSAIGCGPRVPDIPDVPAPIIIPPEPNPIGMITYTSFLGAGAGGLLFFVGIIMFMFVDKKWGLRSILTGLALMAGAIVIWILGEWAVALALAIISAVVCSIAVLAWMNRGVIADKIDEEAKEHLGVDLDIPFESKDEGHG